MTEVKPIKIAGLAELNRALRSISNEAPKQLRLAGNEAAQIVVDWAAARIPVKTGRARAALRASSTRTESRVQGGNARVPYYPWLDFGGRVGRKKSIQRQFLKGGRFIFPGLAANREQVEALLEQALVKAAEAGGMKVSDG